MIICTGYSETIDGVRARAVGARDLLMKPFALEALSKSVQRALR